MPWSADQPHAVVGRPSARAARELDALLTAGLDEVRSAVEDVHTVRDPA